MMRSRQNIVVLLWYIFENAEAPWDAIVEVHVGIDYLGGILLHLFDRGNMVDLHHKFIKFLV